MADSSIGETVAGVANVVHGAGEVIRGRLLDLTDCGKGTGKNIAAEGKAEFERGSNKIGLAHKLAAAPSTHTGAAADSESAGPHTATGVSTSDPRRDTDPGHHTEKETVPPAVNGNGSARPEHDEKRPTPRTTPPGPPRPEGEQFDTEKGQKITGTTPGFQRNKRGDTANDPGPTFAGGQREESGTANVPE